ncbi:MAG: GNAT family N-acetyltransferase [Clostridiales bacterium]|jgi:RimJ/RimL family protein N-acetyltransferase/SAM-dependent methyltransferase|nr:GNAT family N-acetyltransferase [Clostridiales bacterium]
MNVNIDISKSVLETDRLILRAFREDDLCDLYEYARVPGVGEMAGWPHHESIETSKLILRDFLEKNEVFALVLKENGKVLGSLGLHYSWANNEPKYAKLKSKEIGYALSRDYWGRGLVPEAVSAVIAMCFNEYGCDMLTCGHFSTNSQSRRVIEKSGFKFEKQSVYHSEQLNKDFDDMKYVLLRCKRSDESGVMDSYTDLNAKIIDSWVDKGWEWSVPLSHETFENAKKGKWDVVLTPIKPVPHEWFAPYIRMERLDGVKLLGLASGGGQQMPVFAALGADCAVLDYSKRQLDREREVAEREGYSIDIVRADMTKGLPFENNSFDVIFHPVSNCYVENVFHIWNECWRVLKSGGILLAGMDNGFNFLFDDPVAHPLVITNKLPYNPLKNPEQMRLLADSDSGVQFSHTFDEQIGGQLKAGFVITSAYEDFNNDPDSIADGIPAYWASKAVKPPLKWDGAI